MHLNCSYDANFADFSLKNKVSLPCAVFVQERSFFFIHYASFFYTFYTEQNG